MTGGSTSSCWSIHVGMIKRSNLRRSINKVLWTQVFTDVTTNELNYTEAFLKTCPVQLHIFNWWEKKKLYRS